MPMADYRCSTCGERQEHWFPSAPDKVQCLCGAAADRIIVFTGKQHVTACHPTEACVYYEHPGTGDVQYTGRNDVAMPERLAQRGYVRREMRTLKEIQKFEKRHKVINEAAWYDRGSGRSYDGAS
jgi:hypothetical protein